MAIAWTSSESAGNGRCMSASVRRMLASAIASAWSDFARVTRWRSRYRATAIGLIEYTVRPVVPRQAISNPRAVSTATGIGSPAVSPASVSSSSRRRKPAASSLTRRLATSFPAPSTSATSWWLSAQSMPHVIVDRTSLFAAFMQFTSLQGHAAP
jgi:hypothetical protein